MGDESLKKDGRGTGNVVQWQSTYLAGRRPWVQSPELGKPNTKQNKTE